MPVSRDNLDLGKKGEEEAVGLLQRAGYKILFKNYKTRLGEIDIIASDEDALCFVEVKTRHSGRFGEPAEAVSPMKQRQISKAALIFLKENKLLDKKARFDVMSLVCSKEGITSKLIKNAFELSPGYIY